jgi:hypothetical protein
VTDTAKSKRWVQHAMTAVVVVILVALGARLAWTLLAPLLPGLVFLLMLLVFAGIVLGKVRR